MKKTLSLFFQTQVIKWRDPRGLVKDTSYSSWNHPSLLSDPSFISSYLFFFNYLDGQSCVKGWFACVWYICISEYNEILEIYFQVQNHNVSISLLRETFPTICLSIHFVCVLHEQWDILWEIHPLKMHIISNYCFLLSQFPVLWLQHEKSPWELYSIIFIILSCDTNCIKMI